AFGSSPSMPVLVGEVVEAGPLTVQVKETLLGPEADQRVLDASPRNLPPVEGFTYALALVSLQNNGARALFVDNDDFGFITSARRIWTRLQIVPPQPSMHVLLQPGDSFEGWVAGQPEDDKNLLLTFNCRDLGGSWSERFVALGAGSAIVGDTDTPGPNDAGKTSQAPALIGETVVTKDWSLTILEIAYADEVFALFPPEDYRTTALGSAAPDLVPYWIAFQISLQQVRNDGTPRHFPVDALNLSGSDGQPIPDVRILSAPMPELSGSYLPGGRAIGWYAIELPVDYGDALLRFQPYRADEDVRYLTWADGIASPSPEGG
ncbi:MAG: hypothetical protein AB7G88_10455, partial [Thermomicrobiales bacterium]